MEFSPLNPAGRQLIQSYGDGGFRISGARHEGSVLVFPLATMAWSVAAVDELSVDSLQQVAAAAPRVDILVLGTGQRMLAVPSPIRRHFRAAGITFEVMDTGAACRTYNVLMGDDRRVAAALIAIG